LTLRQKEASEGIDADQRTRHAFASLRQKYRPEAIISESLVFEGEFWAGECGNRMPKEEETNGYCAGAEKSES
jgi:hypothetical protein